MHQYRVAIVGCGQIASTFEEDPKREHPCTHAGVYDSFSKTKIISVADINKERLNKFSKRWKVRNVYLDYNEMLRKEKIDILSVCTNTPFHSKVVLDAAKSGVKAIFCEKPISSSLEEADKMIVACKKNNVKLIINHTRRWDTYYNKVKEMIDKGIIGKINSIIGHYDSGLMIMGTHLFDVMRYYCGDIIWVVGKKDRSKYGNYDPTCSGYLQFKNNINGYVVGHTGKDYLIFEIDIIGTEGRIRISKNGRKFELWKLKESKHYSGYTELKEKSFPEMGIKRNWMISAIEDVANTIENNKEGKCTGEDGRAAVEVAHALYISSKNNSKIKLPIKNRELILKSR